MQRAKYLLQPIVSYGMFPIYCWVVFRSRISIQVGFVPSGPLWAGIFSDVGYYLIMGKC